MTTMTMMTTTMMMMTTMSKAVVDEMFRMIVYV
jgi:hypothetical protein